MFYLKTKIKADNYGGAISYKPLLPELNYKIETKYNFVSTPNYCVVKVYSRESELLSSLLSLDGISETTEDNFVDVLS